MYNTRIIRYIISVEYEYYAIYYMKDYTRIIRYIILVEYEYYTMYYTEEIRINTNVLYYLIN